jgi:hypothetical protein
MVHALDRVATGIGIYVLLKALISPLKYYTLQLITVLNQALNLDLFMWGLEMAFFSVSQIIHWLLRELNETDPSNEPKTCFD